MLELNEIMSVKVLAHCLKLSVQKCTLPDISPSLLAEDYIGTLPSTYTFSVCDQKDFL